MGDRAVRDFWQGYGYDHLPGCTVVPRCTCGFVETMRRFFELSNVETNDKGVTAWSTSQ